MRSIAVGVVERSRNAQFPAGTQVSGIFGAQEYAVSDGQGVNPRPPGPPPEAALAVFGHIGMTAYFGVTDIGRPKAGETMVVSGAAGAVGSLAGQIGKILGCRVVGIAGTDEKCSWVRDELGFDAAINYRSEDIKSALAHHCPTGIDVYFDNVGGPILDAVLEKINLGARIALCGMISDYTRERGMGITNSGTSSSSARGSRASWSWITGRARWRRCRRWAAGRRKAASSTRSTWFKAWRTLFQQ